MARLAIYLLTALDLALVIWGQQTFAPIVPTFPPPPTMNAVINGSVVVFVGEPVVVGEDVRVTIDCSPLIDEAIAGGISNPTVTWFRDGNELTNATVTNVQISADMRLCIITDTLLAVGGQLGNEGNYSCQVCDDPTGPNCRNEITCNAVCGYPHIVPPTVPATVNPFFISLTCGQDVTIESLVGVVSLSIGCQALNGSEPLVTEIYKDGELLGGTGFTFTMLPPSDDDFGTYTFALSTEKCGTTTAVSRIIRHGVPPDIDEGPFIPQPPTVMPGDMTVTIGTPTYIVDGFEVTLVCNIVSGTRPITIMWIRNGAFYPAGGNQSIITVPDTDYNDGDVFTCRADNTIGFDMENTTINVFEPPQILPIPFPTPPPGEITVSTGQPMNTTIITLGTDVTIYCPSSGIDTPSIEWFRNGVMVVAGGRFTISTTTLPGAVITSVLRIDDFQGSDAGTYTCTATNVVGSDDGGTTLLGATAPPVIVEGQCIPQPEVIPNNDVTVMIGSPAYIADGYDLTITCNIINGIPPINISWYRNGVVDSSRGSTSTITISNVDINKDNGVVYTCRAENDNGYDEQLTSVNVFTPLCSHEICRSRRNILCIIPNSMCLCKPQLGYCSAAYYSTETRPLPKACKRCRIPTDLDCIKMWSQCVKKQDEDVHGRPTRRMRTATNFKIYMHPC